MRTVLRIALGVLAALAVVVVAVAGLVGYEVERGLSEALPSSARAQADQRASEAFYQETVKRILSDPDSAFIRSVSAPEAAPARDADALAARIRTQLGPFVGCDATVITLDSTYEADIGLFRHARRSEVTADYKTRCLFGDKVLETRAGARKTGDGWRLTRLELGAATPPPDRAI